MLPVGRNSPQRAPYGLCTEQLSGTAFTAPCASSHCSWLYRIRPLAMHEPFKSIEAGRIGSDFSAAPACPPNQLRWNPLPMPKEPTDLIDGIVTMAGVGDAAAQTGGAAHWYAVNKLMEIRSFYNAEGELLYVPQSGRHRFVTEFGVIDAEPQEVIVIPRGVRFRLDLQDGGSPRGYNCENYCATFRRTLVLSRGDFGIFIERPITAVALGVCVLMLVGSIWSYSKRRAKADADAQLVATDT